MYLLFIYFLTMENYLNSTQNIICKNTFTSDNISEFICYINNNSGNNSDKIISDKYNKTYDILPSNRDSYIYMFENNILRRTQLPIKNNKTRDVLIKFTNCRCKEMNI